VQFKVDTDAYLRRFHEEMESRLHKATETLAREVRSNIAATGGENDGFPRQDTGELHSSIETKVVGSELRGYVYSDAEHAPHVERVRPFLSRTFNEIKGTLKSIFTGRK